jgi:phosphoribosylglycinamide formyltransferase-1
LAVLISGTGRNMQAILHACQNDAIQADPVLVLSNRPDATGLNKAESLGVATTIVDHTEFESRESFDLALAETLHACQPDIVVLAGFMRILTAGFIRQFEGRMFNIHPSLLPKYRGLHTHKRALEAGDTQHGASVHYVTEELDAGAVIKQGQIRIRPEDDQSSLAQRVMDEVELALYPEVLSWAASGRLTYSSGQAWLDGRALTEPLIGDY